MNKVIRFLPNLELSLDDEKTIRYLISLCRASEDFMKLYAYMLSSTKWRGLVLQAWDGFEKNGNKKRKLASIDSGLVFLPSRYPKGKAGKKIFRKWRKYLLREIQKFGKVVENTVDSPRLVQNVDC